MYFLEAADVEKLKRFSFTNICPCEPITKFFFAEMHTFYTQSKYQ